MRHVLTSIVLAALVAAPVSAADPGPLGFAELAALRNVGSAHVSPDGAWIAYTVSVPRTPGEGDDGPAWTELHVASVADGKTRPYIQGEVSVSSVDFTRDGRWITYRAKRQGDDHTSVWAIPVAGGESVRLVGFDTAIAEYSISPDASRIAFIATEPEPDAKKKAKDKGYSQEIYEEDWLPARVWVAAMPPETAGIPDPAERKGENDDSADEPRALTLDGSPFHVKFSPDGASLLVDVAPTPLIDDRYMHRRIHVIDAGTGAVRATLDNQGKLGDFAFSPDGSRVALIAAADPNDPRDGRLMLAASSGGALTDLLPNLEGHVTSFAWKDARTLMYVADIGTETELGEIDVEGQRRPLLTSGRTVDGVRVPVITGVSVPGDRSGVALVGSTPSHPAELWYHGGGPGLRRLTDSNPWLARITLGRQETVRLRARDGLEFEGVLIRPTGSASGPAPLLLMVHGGPEGHDHNGWVTSYSRPGQLAAGRGFAVLYPNYRGSTGRGVAFSKLSQGDAAGKEFDDLVDAIDRLAEQGIADPARVGITGGSYGGYATAWCSTRYTDRFKAGVMFVGISNKLSKGLTTEIPVEDVMVHTLFDPWTRWEYSLERSPIYWAEQSRTPLLIAGGTADTRVHPSQSLQLYRALKGIGKSTVRYVRYPGEPHGNRRAASRDDYARRLMRWMEHYVTGPGGEPPPVELED